MSCCILPYGTELYNTASHHIMLCGRTWFCVISLEFSKPRTLFQDVFILQPWSVSNKNSCFCLTVWQHYRKVCFLLKRKVISLTPNCCKLSPYKHIRLHQSKTEVSSCRIQELLLSDRSNFNLLWLTERCLHLNRTYTALSQTSRGSQLL